MIGLAALGMVWMPAFTKWSKISYSLFYVLFGGLIYFFLGDKLPWPDPQSKNTVTLHLAELTVIISLIGTGLKIDQPFSLRKWRTPLRLVSITMLLSIFIVTVCAHYFLGFDLASSILLGAILAPTDPVLASDVQVGPPNDKEKDRVKFSLTAEAGMNDGSAFPFTWLAVAIAASGSFEASIQEWILVDLLYKIIAGLAAGWLLGKFLGYIIFTLSERSKHISLDDGFAAVAIALLVYGVTEMIHGYGFIAVFVCAVTLRNYEMGHKYHRTMHEFTDQIERVLVAVVLILFGGSIVSGILNALTWPMALFAIAFVFVIRPLSGMLSLLGTGYHIKEKMAISFFGIKGIGTFFYLAFALHETAFLNPEELWSLAAFVVLISITIHGLTATSVMKKLELKFSKKDP